MSWTRAVWFECKTDGSLHEFEETIPSNWIIENIVYWPPRSIEASSIKNLTDPSDDWFQFELKYIKITGNK